MDILVVVVVDYHNVVIVPSSKFRDGQLAFTEDLDSGTRYKRIVLYDTLSKPEPALSNSF